MPDRCVNMYYALWYRNFQYSCLVTQHFKLWQTYTLYRKVHAIYHNREFVGQIIVSFVWMSWRETRFLDYNVWSKILNEITILKNFNNLLITFQIILIFYTSSSIYKQSCMYIYTTSSQSSRLESCSTLWWRKRLHF